MFNIVDAPCSFFVVLPLPLLSLSLSLLRPAMRAGAMETGKPLPVQRQPSPRLHRACAADRPPLSGGRT